MTDVTEQPPPRLIIRMLNAQIRSAELRVAELEGMTESAKAFRLNSQMLAADLRSARYRLKYYQQMLEAKK